jgi:hypothetical protein
VGAAAITEFGVDVSRLHWDLTSISRYGAYPQSAVLAQVTVTAVGEEASAGTLKSAGFFDTVNIGDQAFLAPADAAAPPKGAAQGAAKGNASTGIPATGAPGGSAAGGSVAASEPQQEWPGLFTAIRALR